MAKPKKSSPSKKMDDKPQQRRGDSLEPPDTSLTCHEILDGAEKYVHQKQKPIEVASISSMGSRGYSSRASSVATDCSSLSADSCQPTVCSQISSGLTLTGQQITDGTNNAKEGTDMNRKMIEEIRGLKESVNDLGIIMKQSNALLQQQQLTMEATRKVIENQTELLHLKLRLQMATNDACQKVLDEFENSTVDNNIHQV